MSTVDQEPSTRITLRDVYQVALETKDAVNPLPPQVRDHEVRIRAIEKYLWIWIGASGVLGAGASQLISFLISQASK